MALAYNKDYDQIKRDILTDYQNLDSNPDVSQGSMPNIMGSVLASMIWGIFKKCDYNKKQMFVDTADAENLRKWGAIYDIPYLDTDTDSSYLNKILRFIRQAPAGGNKQDFEDWALDQNNCFYEYDGTVYYNGLATVVPAGFGAGTVGIYTVPTDETIVDVTTPVNIEENLRAVTQAYIETVRPLGMLAASVVSAKPFSQSITMTVQAKEGEFVDEAAIATAIEDNLNLMVPGEPLYTATLICIAMSYGAINPVLSLPAGNVLAANDRFIRPNIITVTEV
jgi:uncharacterized phage protein gp47/JayE